MGRLNDLPDNVKVMILEKLPIREAVQKSILSSAWLDKWTFMSVLCFDRNFLPDDATPDQYLTCVKSILLQHVGDIFKFEIDVPAFIPGFDPDNMEDEPINIQDVDPITIEDVSIMVRFCLRNNVRELCLSSSNYQPPIPMPSRQLFSAYRLSRLELTNCLLDISRGFRGFPNLKVLKLDATLLGKLVVVSTLVSGCPILEEFEFVGISNANERLVIGPSRIRYIKLVGYFKYISLVEVRFLKSLELHLESGNYQQGLSPTDYLIHLFHNFSCLEHLTLGEAIFQLFVADTTQIPKKFGVDLGRLKSLAVESVTLDDEKVFAWLLCLMASSPNLQNLKINASGSWYEEMDSDPLYQNKTNGYSDCSLGHLQCVDFKNFFGNTSELAMIEFLLRSSPILEVLSISFHEGVNSETREELRTVVRGFPQISERADVVKLAN